MDLYSTCFLGKTMMQAGIAGHELHHVVMVMDEILT